MRRIAGLGSALVMVVGLLVAGVGSPANAQYQVTEHVGIRMYDINKVVPGCANYPVEYVVGNVSIETVWVAELFIVQGRGGDPIRNFSFSGTGPESGRKQFRLCSQQIVGGLYTASIYFGECGVPPEPGVDVPCPGRTITQPLTPATVIAPAEDEVASITTLFKRTSDVRLWLLLGNPARGAPVAMRGNLRLGGVDGKLRFVGNRFVKIYGQKGPTSPFTYIATVRTDRYGAYTLALSHRRSSSYRAVYEGSPAYFPDSARTSPVFLD